MKHLKTLELRLHKLQQLETALMLKQCHNPGVVRLHGVLIARMNPVQPAPTIRHMETIQNTHNNAVCQKIRKNSPSTA